MILITLDSGENTVRKPRASGDDPPLLSDADVVAA